MDFQCRAELTVTTFKGFFEVFIASIRHEYGLHRDLMEPNFNYIGLSLAFDQVSQRPNATFCVVSISQPSKFFVLLASNKAS